MTQTSAAPSLRFEIKLTIEYTYTEKVLIQLIWLGQEKKERERESTKKKRAWWIGVRVNKGDR